MSGSDDGDDSEAGTKRAASLVVTSSHVAVRAKDCGIRVMERDSGKKTGKINLILTPNKILFNLDHL